MNFDFEEQGKEGQGVNENEEREKVLNDFIMKELIYLPRKEWLHYVFYNTPMLIRKGIYEELLLDAYTGIPGNTLGISMNALFNMFTITGNREKLLKAGDPLPGEGPFTVYRGVAGTGAARRLRNLSWTADFDKAVWFARRWEILRIEKPMVYETVVQSDQVLAYYDGRNEKEFICLLPDDQPLKRVWSYKDIVEPENAAAA